MHNNLIFFLQQIIIVIKIHNSKNRYEYFFMKINICIYFNMEKYFKIEKYETGEIISMLIEDLNTIHKYNHILFIRTQTTGQWLDNLYKDNKNITRILYYTDKTGMNEENKVQKVKKNNKKKRWNKKKSIIKSEFWERVHSNQLEDKIKSLNKKFDLICIDPFHEYDESKRDFTLLLSLLNDDGKIISHDCYPPKKLSVPKYITGEWSGVTYLTFVEIAYKNPDYYYGILNIDTGIGIISKKEFLTLKNNLNKEKQEELLLLHQNNDIRTYDFFTENCKDLINMIDYNES